MNDPLLGFVVGLIAMTSLVIGSRLGYAHGYMAGLREKERAARNGAPKVKASWLKPNKFSRQIDLLH